ncbi:MAG: amino acid adenylation domain-containing protein, partial [Bacteroidota bacterium]
MSSKQDKLTKKASLLDKWRSKKKAAKAINTLSPRPAAEPARPSKGQQRLWLLQQLYPDNPFYQYAHFYEIKGLLDLVVWQRSFQLLVDRHEVLRTNFQETDQELLLNIHPQQDFQYRLEDLSVLSPEEQQAKASELIQAESRKVFDLETDPLYRVFVIRLSDHHHQLVLSMHHIIGDRWSLRLLNEELFANYKLLSQGKEVEKKALAIQYSDFAHWQAQQKIRPESTDYWQQKLSGDLPLLDVPSSHKRSAQASFQGANLSRPLSPKLSDGIRQLAQQQSVTMYSLLLAAFKLLLHRHSRQTDIIIGSPFSNRDKTDLEALIGFFNETLVLRTQLQEEWTFQDLIQDVKKTTLEAFEHKEVSFDELVRRLQPERIANSNPFFQAMFLYNSILPFSIPELGLQIEDKVLDLGVSKFDLTLFITDRQDHLELSLEYALDLFTAQRAHRLLEQLEVILQSVVEQIDLPLYQIPILPEAEKQQLLEEWNDTKESLPAYQAIHQLIEEQARLHPERVAVAHQEDSITYADLDRQASAVAAALREAGAGPKKPIGLYAHRSVEALVGLLGILKAGAPYLPLDPNYPLERIEYMLEDSGSQLLLCQQALQEQLSIGSVQAFSIEELASQEVSDNTTWPLPDATDWAYIIYTSGSTGRPKGVPIQHQNLLHSTLARHSFYPSNPTAFLLLSSFSFDSSVVGLFWTLCSGGTLVLPEQRIEQDVDKLGQIIARHRISHTLMLPSLYSMILNHAPVEKLQTLRNVMVAGEACPFSLIEKHYRLLPEAELYNEYGPTEASVWCIAHKILPGEKDFVPIGKAIPNTEAYILGKGLKLVPIGVAGELYIGGLGLAEGYLHRPELTAERFIKHPFREQAGARLYKTGDLARFHPDGRIEFLGRADHQVKIRGFRVEPSEIEKNILQQPGIEEAVVVVHPSPQQGSAEVRRLIAYIPELPADAIAQLRLTLEQQLPFYMVPDAFIPLADFPCLPNGKVNRKNLPDPGSIDTVQSTEYLAPRNEEEKILVQIWEESLGKAPIGVKDNFFAIGGDSILSIQVVSKARQQGIQLAPTQLFEQQTIEQLALGLEKTTAPTNDLPPNPTEGPLSFLQQAFLFNSQKEEADQGLLQLEFTIVGKLDVDAFQQAWQWSAQKHDAMRAHLTRGDKGVTRQAIADSCSFHWHIQDWRAEDASRQAELLAQWREADANLPLDLYQAPVARLSLIQLDEDRHLFFWTCHHLFLDGWSCGIVLQDALQCCDQLSRGEQPALELVPSYLAFLNWRGQQDSEAETAFWTDHLQGFQQAQLFANAHLATGTFEDVFWQLSETDSAQMRQFCQQQSISLSTLCQGLWALLLGALFDQRDVLFGLTVSGRFANFPQIDQSSGLYMNVIPNRFHLPEAQPLGEWLREIQQSHRQKNQFENVSLEQIKQVSQLPASSRLFDLLFVFGNFLKDGLQVGSLTVEHFQGGFTSSYPLTMRVNPLDAIEIDWRYDSSILGADLIKWVKDAFVSLAQSVASSDAEASLDHILASLPPAPSLPIHSDEENQSDLAATAQPHIAARNQLEAELTRIWRQFFPEQEIGIEDNFFELGGNSLMALQVFARIGKELDIHLPPSLLIRCPTIATLAAAMEEQSGEQLAGNSLVPLREEGDKPPLFCVHGGGAHVFFYQNFASHLPPDQPVFSLQPKGLDGRERFPESIEEMAQHYIELIR